MTGLKWPGNKIRATEPARTPISRAIVRLASLSCLVLFCSATAFGFCFAPHPSVACQFLNSDAVFTGKVISVRPVEDRGFTDGWYYQLSVIQLFRGPQKKVIEVYTGNDSGRYPLDLGKEYLLFASVEYDEPNKSELSIGGCDDNAPLAEAGKLISEIEKMRIPLDGIIEGFVALQYVPNNYVPNKKGVPGIKVSINGKSGRYRLVTDQEGWFRLHVPPGQYSIKIESTPARKVEAFDLNYGGKPELFSVDAGKCAGFEFIADPKYEY